MKDLLPILQKHLPADYEQIKKALEKKEWEELKDVNHALLGALLYCDIPYLKNASIMVQNASLAKIEAAANQLLNAIEKVMNYVV
jgi:HPt (histidine-containing phosphotransfer) domain-containing protein